MNRAERRAAKLPRAIPGTAERCPKCSSTRVRFDPSIKIAGYGPGIAGCFNCKAIWEPINKALLWDPSDPLCSFSEPCDNCAFRPGSNEQKDREKWKEMIANLKDGASFYCHKGVPIETDAKHGFAYPTKKITAKLDGCEPVEIEVEDRAKLRICRGYLNALGQWWAKGASGVAQDAEKGATADTEMGTPS